LQLGLAGAALAFSCSQGTTALLLVLYTVVRDARMAANKHEEATWCRPSMAMFAGRGCFVLDRL
jgi:Na+-driven multidrug efflux pump